LVSGEKAENHINFHLTPKKKPPLGGFFLDRSLQMIFRTLNQMKIAIEMLSIIPQVR
jgi:hypothetical protein